MSKNQSDMVEKGLLPIKTAYKHLSRAEKLQINTYHAQGISANQIGKMLGKSQTSISAYLRKISPEKQKQIKKTELFRKARSEAYLQYNRVLLEKSFQAISSISDEDIALLGPNEKARLAKDLSLPLGITFDKMELLDNKGKSTSTLTLIIQRATDLTLAPSEDETGMETLDVKES